MASLTHEINDHISISHMDIGIREFSRLERMLLFAVISECERCIGSEGFDCFDSGRHVSCPFVAIREEYHVTDLLEWKEMLR